MKKVVLAGGSGFLGRSLSRVLLAKGYQVVNLTRGQLSTLSLLTYLAVTSSPF